MADKAPTRETDRRKYKVDTLNRATGIVVTGKAQAIKRKPLYPPNLAPIGEPKDPMAKKVRQRQPPKEP